MYRRGYRLFHRQQRAHGQLGLKPKTDRQEATRRERSRSVHSHGSPRSPCALRPVRRSARGRRPMRRTREAAAARVHCMLWSEPSTARRPSARTTCRCGARSSCAASCAPAGRMSVPVSTMSVPAGDEAHSGQCGRPPCGWLHRTAQHAQGRETRAVQRLHASGHSDPTPRRGADGPIATADPCPCRRVCRPAGPAGRASRRLPSPTPPGIAADSRRATERWRTTYNVAAHRRYLAVRFARLIAALQQDALRCNRMDCVAKGWTALHQALGNGPHPPVRRAARARTAARPPLQWHVHFTAAQQPPRVAQQRTVARCPSVQYRALQMVPESTQPPAAVAPEPPLWVAGTRRTWYAIAGTGKAEGPGDLYLMFDAEL